MFIDEKRKNHKKEKKNMSVNFSRRNKIEIERK